MPVFYGSETWSLVLRYEHGLRVSENRVLRRVFDSKRDEVTGEWRKLHNEELNDLYWSHNIVRVTKSGRKRWAGHVALMGEGEAYTGFWLGHVRESDHLEDPSVDEKVILEWILKELLGKHGLD